MNFGLAEGLAILVPLSYGGLWVYLTYMNKKMVRICDRLEILSNGCFERHAKIERELGQNQMIGKAVHCRVDRLEETLKEDK